MVYHVWTTFRLELRLFMRSRGLWLAVPITAGLGVWEASMAREEPFFAWSQFIVAALFATLILVLSTGGQVAKDRECHVDGVLLSTPVSTTGYVWGKYLAGAVVLLMLAVAMLAGAVAMDRFDIWRDPPAILGHAHFPPLGLWPYVSAWLWLVVVPIMFGAALMLATVTISRGHRVVSSILVIFLWLGPAMLGSAVSDWLAGLLDVASMTFYSAAASIPVPPGDLQQVMYSGSTPPPALAARVVQFVDAHLPPALPNLFYWNRALFATLTILLVLVTVQSVRSARRGA